MRQVMTHGAAVAFGAWISRAELIFELAAAAWLALVVFSIVSSLIHRYL